MDGNKKKIPLALVLSIGIPIVLIATLLIVLVSILSDKNRNTHVKSDAQYAEIVKKNVIKGFKDTETTGKFTFSLEEDDINDLLGGAAEALNTKYVESIYYENKEDKHTFYVDLGGIPIKSRVALTTSIKDSNDSKIHLNIDSIKVGKLNASNFVTKKLFEFSDKINSYFTSAHIPVSLDSENKDFVVDPFSYISTFPEGSTTSVFWDIIEENKDLVTIEKSKFGLTVDFSAFRSSPDLAVKEYTDPLPDFKANIEEKTPYEYGIASTGNVKVYWITEDVFNQLLQASLPTDKKEELTSTLTDKKAVFNLVGTKTTIITDEIIDVGTIYSLNGYLVDAHIKLDYSGESGKNYVAGAFFISNDEDNYPITLGSSRTIKGKPANDLKTSLSKTLEKTEEKQTDALFTWNGENSSLNIDLKEMNDTKFVSPLKDAEKYLEVNPTDKTLDFIVCK